ncbi:MAG: hypothetical protein K8T90_00115 [Planctomycetes bacterium]|nr:hypothetical protein [Planctomycetota bacterium]
MRRTVGLLALAGIVAAVALAWTTCSGPAAVDAPPVGDGGAPAPRTGTPPTRAPRPERLSRPRAARPGEAPGSPAAATSGPAPEAVAAPMIAGELPEDALGTGPCELFLNLVDDSTGAPLAAKVRLWRLGVPEDERWTAGDHVQKKGNVPAEGIRWSALPAGRYLVQVDAQRRAAAAIPVVALDRAASVTVRAQMPRTFPVRVIVCDAFGGRIDSASVKRGAGGSSLRSPRPPVAVVPRRPRVEDTSATFGMGGGSSSFFTSRRATPIVGGPDGFELGTITEGSNEGEPRATWTLSFAEGCNVDVRAVGEEAGKGTYVAFTEPLAPIVAGVHLPDGRLAADAGAKVTAACIAVLRGPTDPADRWRDAVVEVRVALGGFLDATFEHRVGESPPQIVMAAAGAEFEVK